MKKSKDTDKRTKAHTVKVERRVRRRYLLAEYCANEIFEGWHLYVRESKRKGQRNKNGDWGWLRGEGVQWYNDFLSKFGIKIKGDGTCNGDGIDKIAKKFPLRSFCGGKPRGCIEIPSA
jgi:hypothetical protein